MLLNPPFSLIFSQYDILVSFHDRKALLVKFLCKLRTENCFLPAVSGGYFSHMDELN